MYFTRILSCLLLWLFHSDKAFCQPANLVFEGAGIRGIAYCGVLQEMESNSWLPQLQRVGGTSAGAVTALAVSLGYNSNEIQQLILRTPFRKFNESPFFFAGGMHRIHKYFGWYKTSRMHDWLGQIIAAKTGDADITFRQLKASGKYKDLYVTGTCLNRQQLIVFSHETYPDMKVRDAVRISMSVPLYFEAVFIDRDGKTYNHPENKTGLDVMVDGGFTGNFPIRLFDSTRYLPSFDGINRFTFNPQTLGCRIDTDEQIILDRNNRTDLAAVPVNSLKQYFAAFYTIIIENLNRQTLTREDWSRTISISDGQIGPRVRKMKKEEIERLITNGSGGFRTFIQSNP